MKVLLCFSPCTSMLEGVSLSHTNRSAGESGIVDMQGTVVQQARQLTAGIVVAEI